MLLALLMFLVVSALLVVIARRAVRWAMQATQDSVVVKQVVEASQWLSSEASGIKADAGALGDKVSEMWVAAKEVGPKEVINNARSVVGRMLARLAAWVAPEDH
jgi:predicted component of type VI protein secretion system